MFLFATQESQPVLFDGWLKEHLAPSPFKTIQYSLIVHPSFLPQAKGRHAPRRWPLVTFSACYKKRRGSCVQLYHLFYRGLARFLQAHANPQPRSGFDALYFFRGRSSLPAPRHTPWCQFGSSGCFGSQPTLRDVDRFIWCSEQTATSLLLSLLSLHPS